MRSPVALSRNWVATRAEVFLGEARQIPGPLRLVQYSLAALPRREAFLAEVVPFRSVVEEIPYPGRHQEAAEGYSAVTLESSEVTPGCQEVPESSSGLREVGQAAAGCCLLSRT